MTTMQTHLGLSRTLTSYTSRPSTPRSVALTKEEEGPLDCVGAAVRLVFGALFVGGAMAWLAPMVSMASASPHPLRLHGLLFDGVMALALMASGVMLPMKRTALVAMTFLIPTCVHLLFHCVLFSH